MDMTLLEAAQYSTDIQVRTVARQMTESSPILEYAPVKVIQGAAYTYRREKSLGSIGYRGVGGSWVADSGIIRPETETLCIVGGEVFIDNFEIATMGNIIALKPQKFQMKSRAAGRFISSEFFEGDKTVNPEGIDGLRRRITGNQLIYMDGSSTGGGATLTLAGVNQLLDAIVGNADALFMNKTLRRKISSLVEAQTGSFRITTMQDAFGRQLMAYNNVPIRIIENEEDASTFLDFDEDDGQGHNDTASIYAVRFGDEFAHIIATGALPNVKDFGEIEARPGHLGRIEHYMGIAVEHPRSVARIGHINNA